MISSVLTFAWPRRGCWNPSLKDEGFICSGGAQQMLVHKKTMFDRYYCIKTHCDARNLEHFEEIAPVNL